MKHLRYWVWCWRYGGILAHKLTYEQWEVMDFLGRSYQDTVGKAWKKALRKTYG